MEMHSRMNDEKQCGVGEKHLRPATLHCVRQPSKHVAIKYQSHASSIIVRRTFHKSLGTLLVEEPYQQG